MGFTPILASENAYLMFKSRPGTAEFGPSMIQKQFIALLILLSFLFLLFYYLLLKYLPLFTIYLLFKQLLSLLRAVVILSLQFNYLPKTIYQERLKFL